MKNPTSNKAKFSDHCDAIKDEHAYCVDEKSTRLEFAVNLLLDTIICERGCSRNTARIYAAALIETGDILRRSA